MSTQLTSALLLGKGPRGLEWLRANQSKVMPRLIRSLVVSVNSAWAESVVPELWIDYVVACDRLDFPLPRWAGVVHPRVQWGISQQRGYLKVPRLQNPGEMWIGLDRSDVCYDEVGFDEAKARGWLNRSPDDWREFPQLLHDTVSGATALHFIWTRGIVEVLAVGFDGGDGTRTGPYWAGLLAMHRMAALFDMRVTWQPDAVAEMPWDGASDLLVMRQNRAGKTVWAAKR